MTEFAALSVDALIAFALREGFERIDDTDTDAAPGLAAVVELQHRGDRVALDRAIELLFSDKPLQRRFGVRVLARSEPTRARPNPLGSRNRWRRCSSWSSAKARPTSIAEIARAFGYRGDPRAIPVLVSWATHPHQPVRFGVAAALAALAERRLTKRAMSNASCLTSSRRSGPVRDYAMWSINQRGHDPKRSGRPFEPMSTTRTRAPQLRRGAAAADSMATGLGRGLRRAAAPTPT